MTPMVRPMIKVTNDITMHMISETLANLFDGPLQKGSVLRRRAVGLLCTGSMPPGSCPRCVRALVPASRAAQSRSRAADVPANCNHCLHIFFRSQMAELLDSENLKK